MRNLFTVIALGLILWGLSGCKESNGSAQNHDQKLVGTWMYEVIQKRVNNDWTNMPSVTGSDGKIIYHANGAATISMTFNGEPHSQDFEWKLLENGDYYINGELRGKLEFDGNSKFYIYTNETFDPTVGENIPGEYRDVYHK